VFREADKSMMVSPFDLSWLNHPVIIEFINTCKELPTLMVTQLIRRSWITEAISETSITPGWEYPFDCDLWLRTERTLAFRLHHDFILTNSQLSVTVKKSYTRYIERANEGNFTAESPLTHTPLALAGLIYFI
jgi:hypothetical protein